MDEVDSLCGERAGDEGGGGGLVSELLSLMAQTAVQRNIMVIGATNRPHAVDEVRSYNDYRYNYLHKHWVYILQLESLLFFPHCTGRNVL